MSPVTGKRRLEARATPTPTSNPQSSVSRPNMGPMTTGFKAPEHCTRVALACPTCTNAFLGRSCKAGATGTVAVLPEDDAACWPTATAWPRSGHQPFAGFGIYSPAVQCPTGYTSACGAIQTKASPNDFKFQFPLNAGEEAIGCCPQGYECAMHENVGWQTCRQVVTSTKIEAFECGAGGSSKAVEAFQIPFTQDANTIATLNLWAPMLQIVHQPTDLPASDASKASASASTSATAVLAKPGSDPKEHTGMSTGTAVGIAVTPVIIAIIAALVFLFFWRKRRNAGPQNPRQSVLDAAAALPPPPPPGAVPTTPPQAARDLGSSKASFRSDDTDSTKVPSVNGSPIPNNKPSPAPTFTPIYEEQVRLRRETIDPFFLPDDQKPAKTPEGYFDPWKGAEPAPPVPPIRGVYDYENNQYTKPDPDPPSPPIPMPLPLAPKPRNPFADEQQPSNAPAPKPRDPFADENQYSNVPAPALVPTNLSHEPGNEPGPTIRDENPYEGYGYGDVDYPLSPEMFPVPPGMRTQPSGYDSPIDGSSPFRLKRGDTGDSIRRDSFDSDIANQIPRNHWNDDRTPRASQESTWPTTLNKYDSFSRPRPPGSYTPPQRHSPPVFPAPVGSLSPPTGNYSPEPPEHEWKNPMRRADSFSRPRPRNLTPPLPPSPPSPQLPQAKKVNDGDIADQSIDARIMDPQGLAK